MQNICTSKRRKFPATDFILTADTREYDKQFPHFRQPDMIGYFSVTSDHDYSEGCSQLSYLHSSKYEGEVNFNLNHNLGPLVDKTVDKGRLKKLSHILTWIQNHQKSILGTSTNKDSKFLPADFVCWRGLMTTILCTPYENRDDWEIAATKYRGTIYMFAFETENQKQKNLTMTERQQRMCTWGYKFEQYMMTDSPEKSPNSSPYADENAGFCCVLRTRLNQHSILYGAEVDGLDSGVNLDKSDPNPFYGIQTLQKFVELKTSRIIEHRKQEENFKRYKLLKWWGQSFLVGIPKIICGFRDDNGIVKRLKTYKVLNIPRIAEGLWKANICMNFLNKFLNFVKSTVMEDNPCTVYVFRWSPEDKRVVSKYLGENVDYQLLPDWYIKVLEII